MSAVLDFPTIALDAIPAPAVPQDIADISNGKAVVKLNATEAGLAALRADLSGKTYDLTTTKGDKEARADRLRCVTLRTSLEKRRKELKAPALDFGKLIDAEAKRITEAIVALEAPIDAAITADEARREQERQERARIEAERISGLRARVDTLMAGWLTRCGEPDMTAERIGKGIDMFNALQVPPDLADVADYWSAQQSITLGRMQTMQSDLARREESARLAAERAELERQQAAARAEQERQAAELARQRAELEAQQAAVKAEAERLENERRSQEAIEAAKAMAATINEQAQAGVAENPHQQQAGLSLLSPVDAAADGGAGAEAAPTADDAPAAPAFNLTPDPTDLLGDTATAPAQTTEQAARALLDHIAEAFAGRFPSDPKPGRAWFITLKTLASNLNDTI